MDHVYFTTTKHEKGKHLSYDERVLIQIRLKDGGQLTKSLKKSAVLQTPFVMRCAEVLSPYSGNVKCHKAKVVPAESSCLRQTP